MVNSHTYAQNFNSHWGLFGFGATNKRLEGNFLKLTNISFVVYWNSGMKNQESYYNKSFLSCNFFLLFLVSMYLYWLITNYGQMNKYWIFSRLYKYLPHRPPWLLKYLAFYIRFYLKWFKSVLNYWTQAYQLKNIHYKHS